MTSSTGCWGASFRVDVSFLVPFAAGNFLYIAASGFVPEVTRTRTVRQSLEHFASFAAGLGLLLALHGLFHSS